MAHLARLTRRLLAPALVVVAAAASVARAQETRPAAEPSDAARAIRESLARQKVTLHFDRTPIEEAIGFLQDITGLNYVLDAQAGALEGRTVTLRLREVTLGQALDLMLENAGLARSLWCDVVFVHAPGRTLPEVPAVLGLDDATAEALRTRELTLNFPDTPLEDGLDFLRDLLGVNVALTRAAQDHVRAWQQGGGHLALRLRALKARHVLTLLCDQARLTWRLDQGVVTIDVAPEPAAPPGGARGGGPGAPGPAAPPPAAPPPAAPPPANPPPADPDAVLRRRLAQPVTISAQGTLHDFVVLVHDVCQVDVVLSPGVDKNLPLFLDLEQIPAQDMLDIVCELVGVQWSAERGVVVLRPQ